MPFLLPPLPPDPDRGGAERGGVMVEVTDRSSPVRAREGGDAARRPSGPALACRAGGPAGQAQPEEREGGAPVLETRGARGCRRPGGQPKEEERGERSRGKEKGEKKKKRRKEKKRK
jgi:hypothetical protein